MCSGLIPSFDGTPLDTDLTVPDGVTGPLPLMVMLHGWGQSKTDFEATTPAGNGTNTWHWNNVWFAARGFAVLTYSARGFDRSCGQDPATGYTYLTDPACRGKASWTHLADRRWEIHDTQYLAGLLVDAGIASPSRVVVTGDSYGGGQSWLLALSQDRVMLPGGRLVPWRSPHGVPIRLAAAVPQFGWTDLAQALVDNGRASDGARGVPVERPHETPYGVDKASYVDALFALGATTAQHASANDPTADLPGWFAAISAGEPAEQANSLVSQALNQLERYRSAYYLPVPPPAVQVPVFDAQGLTDPLFPGIQAVQLVRKLTAAYPRYPVWVALGDLGHPYAGNPHALWVSVNDHATDPIVGSLATGGASGCRIMPVTTDPGVAAWTWRVRRHAVLAGAPVVRVKVALRGTDAELAARLWDVDPATGKQALITRGVYRLTAPAPGAAEKVAFELWPTGWQVTAGHELTLELTADDSPTRRPDNLPPAMTLTDVSLTSPARP